MSNGNLGVKVGQCAKVLSNVEQCRVWGCVADYSRELHFTPWCITLELCISSLCTMLKLYLMEMLCKVEQSKVEPSPADLQPPLLLSPLFAPLFICFGGAAVPLYCCTAELLFLFPQLYSRLRQPKEDM